MASIRKRVLRSPNSRPVLPRRPFSDFVSLDPMPHIFRPARLRGAVAVSLAALTILGLGSCAYYNTFYIARKYYDRATNGLPYRVDHTDSPDVGNINKSIDYSKKLLANFPKSKWVDDAYLLWARGFLAKDDPLQTVTMLQDFATRFPKSPLKNDATFYRAVALRQARRYSEALTEFDTYFAASPKGELVPYAHLEYSRTLRSLDRPAEAAQAAGIVVDKWPKSTLAVTARIARAEARFEQGDFEAARQDYRFMGEHSRTDDERLEYLLKESECLEAAHQYDQAQGLLHGALSHERPPDLPDTTGGKPLIIPQNAGYDRYGRLLTRIGTVQLLSNDTQGAIASFRRVVDDYPHTPVSAEAQYRVGYALEVGADDFEHARLEYAKVKDQNPSSPFVAQATSRQTTLDQLARYRTAGPDSSDARAQSGFLLAEQYLFQLNKPDRALVEYAKVSSQNVGSPWAGKALNAQAWVLKNKMNQPVQAESLYWKVVHEYPATEAQLAARDYLEAAGKTVPSELIKMPAPTAADTAAARAAQPDLFRPLTPTPAAAPPLGAPGVPDSSQRAAHANMIFGNPSEGTRAPTLPGRSRLVDSSFARVPGPDTLANRAYAGVPPPGSAAPGGAGPQVTTQPAGVSPHRPYSGSPVGDSTRASGTAPVAIPSRAASAPDTLSEFARVPSANAAATLPGVAPAKITPIVPDTIGHAPLPPLEVSPIRPGITWPAGRPRTLGLSREVSNPAPARASAPLGAGPAAAVRDSAGTPTRGAAADAAATRGPKTFRPRGDRYQ